MEKLKMFQTTNQVLFIEDGWTISTRPKSPTCSKLITDHPLVIQQRQLVTQQRQVGDLQFISVSPSFSGTLGFENKYLQYPNQKKKSKLIQQHMDG